MDRWLRNQNVVRVIALVLSVLLWLVVHMEDQQKTPNVVTNTEGTKEIENVSIETVGLDETKFELVSIQPKDVMLRVVGSASDLKKVTPQNAKVRLNLSGAVSGKQSIALTPVGFPSRVDVEIIPASVTVTIEERLTREMPVTIEPVGKPAEGLVVGTPIIQPNRVFVTTPESSIDGIAQIKGKIDVTGAEETVRKQVKLFAYNKKGEELKVEIVPSVVDVEVPITLPSKTVPLQIKLTGTPSPGFSISSVEQTPTDIVVYGNQSVLDLLDFYDGGSLDITSLDADKTITLDIPKKANVFKIEPAKVEVKLHIVPSEQRTFENVKLTITGLSGTYEATIADPEGGTMNVTLEGAPEALIGLVPDDIDLIVDVGNLSAGQHKVNVSYSLPAFVRVVEETPAIVTVDIKEIVVQQGEPQTAVSGLENQTPED